MKEITKQQARRFLLLKHGLLGDCKFHGKDGIMDYISQSGCIQYDPIDVCGKNHELVLQSRVKDFDKQQLYDLLYVDRVLIDLFDKNMAILKVEDWPYFEQRRIMTRNDFRSKKDVDLVSSEVLSYIKDNGPVSSSDLPLDGKVDWGWNPTTLARATLDTLYYRGDLIIHHKKNTRKFYDLTEKYIASEILAKSRKNEIGEHERLVWNVLRRIKSVGLLHLNASYAFIGICGLNAKNRVQIYNELLDNNKIKEVKVSGIDKPFYYCADDKMLMEMALSADRYESRVEFLAPLDNLMWDRNIINELFGFDYKWEVYTPKVQRKYGHYVLPVIFGENFAGRIELIRNKKEKRFEETMWMCEGADLTKNDISNKVLDFEKIMY